MTSLISGEILVFVVCLYIMISGLAKVTLRRQTELLKNYLQPEELPLEKLILRAEKIRERRKANTENPPFEPPTSDIEAKIASWPEEPPQE
ncbi:MAG: hypothetical protein FWC50_05985 [Planctomycetaceae bacterium]|nr:hypothetical protein [Planctomycetaceae bacterium]